MFNAHSLLCTRLNIELRAICDDDDTGFGGANNGPQKGFIKTLLQTELTSLRTKTLLTHLVKRRQPGMNKNANGKRIRLYQRRIRFDEKLHLNVAKKRCNFDTDMVDLKNDANICAACRDFVLTQLFQNAPANESVTVTRQEIVSMLGGQAAQLENAVHHDYEATLVEPSNDNSLVAIPDLKPSNGDEKSSINETTVQI